MASKINERLKGIGKLKGIQLHKFAFGFPKLYFGAVLTAALVGYGIILFFPLLAMVGMYGLQSSFITNGALDYVAITIWAAVIIIGLSISYHISSLKFEVCTGVSLPDNIAPKLVNFIEEHDQGFLRIRLHDIRLTERFELRVEKYPYIGLPLWSKNVLVIGFDFMQMLSKEYFDCALIAKLEQHSKRHIHITHWLGEQAFVWSLYPAALKKRNHLGDRLLARMFAAYARMYGRLARHMVQKSDMKGDAYALSKVNYHSVLEGLEAQAVAEFMLKSKFLPAFKVVLRKSSSASQLMLPYLSMPTTVKKTFNSQNYPVIMKTLMSPEPIKASVLPPLAKRIENIGYKDPENIDSWIGVAGKYYFEASYDSIVKLMSKRWLVRNGVRLPQTPTQSKKAVKKTVAKKSALQKLKSA
jgi:hypothetical protein